MAAALAVAAAQFAVMLTAPSVGRAAWTPALYTLSGAASVNPVTCVGIECPPPETATGTATCRDCAPPAAVFSIRITTVNTYPPGPCRVRSLSGFLRVVWSDGTTSTASVSGAFYGDSSWLILTGTFDPGSGVGATERVGIVLNNFPPGPCRVATSTITGALIVA